MTSLPLVHVLRVFTATDGRFGNPLGVLLGTEGLPDGECQRIATELAFSETVFVDDPAAGDCRIFTPAMPLPFAGHPMVGTAWLLARDGEGPPALRPPAGTVIYGHDEEDWWVQASASWSPPWRLVRVASAEEVERAVVVDADSRDLVWAWTDQDSGAVRARAFGAAFGVPEDEATGSAAIVLAATVDQMLTITQGRGSRLVAAPLGGGVVRVGGRVVLDGQRTV